MLPASNEERLPSGRPDVSGYVWCVRRVALDAAALAGGVFALEAFDGVLRDATPVHLQGEAVAGLRLRWPVDTDADTVFLRVDFDGDVAKPTLSAGRDRDIGDETSALAIARIRRVGPDSGLALDDTFVPPTCVVGDQPVLANLLDVASHLVVLRAETIAAAFGSTQPSELSDFLMLQSLNVASVQLRHLQRVPALHPERLYLAMASLAADLSTFDSRNRLATAVPPYDHDRPGWSLHALLALLQGTLAAVHSPSATKLRLDEKNYGVRIAYFDESIAGRNGRIILAAKSTVGPELLRARLPDQTKIGPVEKIRDLVNQQIPGIRLSALGVAPREIPYDTGSAYFQIHAVTDDRWSEVLASKCFAIHVAGDFPQLEMSLWLLRDTP